MGMKRTAEKSKHLTTFHRDPADRIIVATAQIFGATLLTHDSRIIDAKLVPILN